MIKRGLLLVIVSLVLNDYGYAVKLHTFPDMVSPSMFVMDDRYIYISDPRNPENKIYIYNRVDFKLVKALLRKGEGPQEVIFPPNVSISAERINILAGNKIIFFSRNFEYIGEIRLTSPESSIAPLKNNFVISHLEGKETVMNEFYTLYCIQDNRLKMIKDLAQLPLDMDELKDNLIAFANLMVSWKDKVFIASQNGFRIDVFDENGNKIHTIEKELDKIKAKTKHWEREIEEFKVRFGKLFIASNMEQTLRQKKRLKFLPGIKYMYAGENQLYLQTYDIRGDEDKYIIMDFKGNIIETRWLPKTYGKKRCFFDNRFYFFRENEDGKGWEFHKIELE